MYTMKRTIWFWLCFTVAIILAIYFSVRIVMTGLGHTEISRIRNISISADMTDKDLSELKNIAKMTNGTNTYDVDLSEINNRISNVPGVRYSSVRRLPNGNLTINVSLYRAVALWTDGNYYFPLSADGTIVNKPTDTRTPGHTVFRGTMPSDISKIMNAVQSISGQLDYLEWIENRRWNLHTTGGITVLLPEHMPESAIHTLIVLHQNHNILSKDITTIDMRDDARILVR